MERDFMGLNSKDSVVVVKEEPVETCKDSGFRWPLSSKVGGPQFMSLNSAQDEKPFKAGEIQNSAALTMKQRLLGGIPVTAPHSILPSRGAVAGTTEPWFNSKCSAAPAQLTIIYGGTVNVFDDISPERAQAIMFLAGHGAPPNVVQPRFQLQASASRPPAAAVDGACANHTPNMLPASGLSSPMSVSSHPIGQSDGSSGNKDDMKISKTANTLENPKIVKSLGPVGATTIMTAAVPQSRKASLARFLEKRKERVMNLAPYSLGKKSPECSNPESNGVGFSATSSVATSPLLSGKET